ncbi:MAG: hypothetical protein V4563_14885 [Pseudomonadota bacterium]
MSEGDGVVSERDHAESGLNHAMIFGVILTMTLEFQVSVLAEFLQRLKERVALGEENAELFGD